MFVRLDSYTNKDFFVATLHSRTCDYNQFWQICEAEAELIVQQCDQWAHQALSVWLKGPPGLIRLTYRDHQDFLLLTKDPQGLMVVTSELT